MWAFQFIRASAVLRVEMPLKSDMHFRDVFTRLSKSPLRLIRYIDVNPPSHLVLCRLTQVRWTRYNPSFLEPEVNKELYRKPWDELSEEEKEKQELRALQPIKAAPPSVSCSVFSDPMIRSEKALSLTARSHGTRMSGSCSVLLSLYLLWCTLPSLTAQFLCLG